MGTSDVSGYQRRDGSESFVDGDDAKQSRPTSLTVVRVGGFSGSGLGLVDALSRRVDVRDTDIMPFARRLGMAPFRLASMLEARIEGSGTPWAKTATWSRATQRKLNRDRIGTATDHTLIVQTLPAWVPPRSQPYSIYTDRVGREGAGVGGPFQARFTEGWLKREEEFLRRARHTFVMGPSTKEVLVEEYRLDSDAVHVVGAGVNCELGEEITSDSCRRLLFVGIDWQRKGLLVLLEAFERLRTDHPDIELTVVGGVPPIPPPRGVEFVGRVDPAALDSYYSRADVFVMPTHVEAYGIVFAEALSKGLPCVGTTQGNQAWLIGDAGICVLPGNAGALVDALERIVENYAAYREAAGVRAKRLRAVHTWDAVAAAITRQLSSDTPISDLDL